MFWIVSLVNLVAGYVLAVSLGFVAVRRRGWRDLALHSLLMPAYWLLISAVAYRALWQLVRAPFFWEKTPHRKRQKDEWRAAHNAS